MKSLAGVRKVKQKGSTPRTSYAWEVRYRDPQKRDRSTRAEADDFAEAVDTDLVRGRFLDPQLGKKGKRLRYRWSDVLAWNDAPD